MPFTGPIPLPIRRARALTCALLPRMTPPLSQYRNRTSWRPRSSAVLTMSSGVMDGSPAGASSLRRGHLLGHDLGAEGELATLDRDHRDALLRDVGVRGEGD